MPVVVEIVGNGLKRLTQGTVSVRPSRPPFGGKRNQGRQKSEGWSHSTRAKVTEILERYRDFWRSFMTILLPDETNGDQAKAIFDWLQRWCYENGICALGIAETPKPHFHIAVFKAFSARLKQRLQDALRKQWRKVYGRDIDEKTLDWRERDEPTEAIVKYLSKTSKGVRLVKGKAPWLTFLPYFKTGLPKLRRKFETLTDEEAKKVLGPHKLNFGAAVALDALRKASNGNPKTPLQTLAKKDWSCGTNPVAIVTAVTIATHTGKTRVPRLKLTHQ